MKPLEEQIAEVTELIGGLMKVGDAKTFVDTVCELIDANVAAEREACANILQAEKERLAALVATVTIGGRAGKWQGGIDVLERTLAAIRARGKEDTR